MTVKPARPFTLYPRNRSPRLDPRLFRNPPAEYRGAPFWAWNTRLNLAQLLRQIEFFKQMGFGGFNIHSRTGLATEYLGDAFMRAVSQCVKKARDLKMLCWLYDEDRWPSGYAGGLVTRDPVYRVKHLLWTKTPYGTMPPQRKMGDYTAPQRSEDGRLLARYEISLRSACIHRYRRLKEADRPRSGANLWYAYLESPVESTWFNRQTYVDTLSRSAIERFLEVTHDQYAHAVGKHFGKLIPAIFTDEPQFTKKQQFRSPDETRDLFMPFTTNICETYRKAYNQDLLDSLPELFWNLPDDAPSVTRYRYHDHVAERFAEAFGDTIARWCEKHNIALTGHALGEGQLHSQSRGSGEAMRILRSFHIPGIDILCDRMEYTTAKQAQSVARQNGREAVLSELYGVTNWDYDFAGHKAQGDWQAAMGVSVRVPHLAWVSMAGEAKRDYPASIGYQSPWWKEYKLIEHHFARLNTVLTRGTPLVRVGVIHPIESFWLNYGPIEQNSAEIEAQERRFQELPRWLSHALIDFDYISEASISRSPSSLENGRGEDLFPAGEMRYNAIVVPHLKTIRKTTLQRLEKFCKSRGTIIFAGEVPSLVDAKPSSSAIKLAGRCAQTAWERSALLHALEDFREIDARLPDGSRADSLLHQMRSDGNSRHLFLVNTDRHRPRENVTIRIKGQFSATRLDTTTGQLHHMPAVVERGSTTFTHSFPAAGHLLISLKPGGKTSNVKTAPPAWTDIAQIADPVPVTLSEPNVLLLDQAEWRLDSGAWHPLEEILRLDNLARTALNLPLRTGRDVQPWADDSPAPVVARLQLKFVIDSDVTVKSPLLALEDAASTQIQWNRRAVPSKVTGWWVDEAIQTVALPSFTAGRHELLLTIPFTRRTNLEWCYLLGNFGVRVRGRHAKLTAPVRRLTFGDWTTQGLPFYAGNATYHCKIPATAKRAQVEIPHFKSPLLSIRLNGNSKGRIAFPPYELKLGKLTRGGALDITAYGNRVNAFGAIHHADKHLTWFGPSAWRSTGENWSYAYRLRPMGILTAPVLRMR